MTRGRVLESSDAAGSVRGSGEKDKSSWMKTRSSYTTAGKTISQD